MNDYQNQNWLRKFYNAFRGIWICVVSQNSFWCHVPLAILAIILGFVFKVTPVEGMILAFCITLVCVAELLNTSIEYLSREVTGEKSSRVRDCLDAASGAVLVSALGSAAIGAWIFFPKLYLLIWG